MFLKNSKKILNTIFYCIPLFFIACQTVTIDTTIKRPSEVNMDKYQTVAFVKIENDENHYLTRSILGNVSSNNNLRFVDQKKIDDVIKYNLDTSSDAYSAEGASKIGQLVQADAVIFGDVQQNSWDDSQVVRQQDPYNFLYEREEGEEIPTYYSRKGTVSISVSISVMDAVTGGIIVQKNYTESADTTYGKEENPDNLPEHLDLLPLYQRCCERVASKFAKVVSSYEERLKVKLETVDHPEFDRGLAFAKNGSWDKAADVFREIQEYAKKNQGVLGVDVAASAYFNYGVALQYDGDYNRALRYLDIAYTANPKSIYKQQIDDCRLDQKNSGRLINDF